LDLADLVWTNESLPRVGFSGRDLSILRVGIILFQRSLLEHAICFRFMLFGLTGRRQLLFDFQRLVQCYHMFDRDFLASAFLLGKYSVRRSTKKIIYG
jgi:hypothetical protein